ncbi:unnamed protein product [Auanema sp. JU1783]|nr:unnamed protein product [Auanema sp. JU1783]
MSSNLFTRWQSNLFNPKEFEEILILWNKLKSNMTEETENLYLQCFSDYLNGWKTVIELSKEVEGILPVEAIDDHMNLFSLIVNLCVVKDVMKAQNSMKTGYKYLDKVDDFLPSPFNINALFILSCLKHNIHFPDCDPGMMINRIVRYALMERIESAIRVKKTSAVNDHGFIKYLGKKNVATNEPCVTLTAKDFFDSLLLTDSCNISRLERQLENCESHTKFFYKMMNIADSDSEKTEQT